MRARIFALILLAIGSTAAHAQPVTSIGPITSGHCATFSSNTIIKDSGSACGGGGGGSPGGLSGQVQYNNSGSFGGYSNAQLTTLIQQFTSVSSGDVPASGGGTSNFMRADGTWAPPTATATSVTPGTTTISPSTNGGLLNDVSGVVADTLPAALGIATVATPEQYSGGTGVSDNGSAIQSAANSGATTVQLGCGTYTVITPIVINGSGGVLPVINGSGFCTIVKFAPTANGTLFKFNSGAGELYGGGVTNMQIISADTTYTKIAVNPVDVSQFTMAFVWCSKTAGASTLWTGGSGSTCLQTNGRQLSSFHDLGLYADQPLVIGLNPHTYISGDHFHFWNLYLLASTASSTYHVITVQTGAVLTNTTFDGYQAWVGGGDGFHAVDSTSTNNWGTLRFSNVRTEQGSTSTNYSINIAIAAGNRLTNLYVDNCVFDTARNAITLTRVQGAWFSGGYHLNVGGALTAYNITSANGNDDINFSNMLWGSSDTITTTGLTQQSAQFTTSGSFSTTIPTTAVYNTSTLPPRFAPGLVLMANPANPTGTASASLKMMGLGSTCTFTPVRSTRVFIQIFGYLTNTSAAGASYTDAVLSWNSGAAPAAGTLISQAVITSTGAGYATYISSQGIITSGLAIGTTYWFDISMFNSGGGTSTLNVPYCLAFEVL